MSYRRLLYTIILYLLFPFVILRLLWRSRNNRAYRHRLGERLGFVNLPQNSQSIIWLHAVSVGEIIAAKPLVLALLDDYPNYRMMITSTTPTGSEMVKKLFPDERVEHSYFPYDLPNVVTRFLTRVNPQLLIIVETEIWPNLYAACDKRKIPMMLANARLSERSTNAYKKISSLIQETLRRLDVIAVRSEMDAQHFRALGALDTQIVVAGNIKFDLPIDEAQITKGHLRKQQWGNSRPVWVAASTHQGEEPQILQIYTQLLTQYPDLLLVLIPRHLERFDEVFSLCESYADLETVRHSQQLDYKNCAANIILGDSLGELQSWYASADIVFMGGSLVETGGHNPLEAIALGVPVVSGAHVFNFADVFPILSDAGLCWVCDDEHQLQNQLSMMMDKLVAGNADNLDSLDNLNNPDNIKFRQSADRVMQQFSGVTNRLMVQIRQIVD